MSRSSKLSCCFLAVRVSIATGVANGQFHPVSAIANGTNLAERHEGLRGTASSRWICAAFGGMGRDIFRFEEGLQLAAFTLVRGCQDTQG
jgi:hypothetical protein